MTPTRPSTTQIVRMSRTARGIIRVPSTGRALTWGRFGRAQGPTVGRRPAARCERTRRSVGGPAARRTARRSRASACGAGAAPGAGRPHASTSPTDGSPATPLRLGRHDGGPDEQDTAPDQTDRDVAALATRTRWGGARRRAPRRTGRRTGRRRGRRRGSRRAALDTRVITFDLHDDRPFLSVRELVTDEDLAVLGLVDGVAADLDRVLARLEHLVTRRRADALAHPHFRAGGGGVRRRRERDQAGRQWRWRR